MHNILKKILPDAKGKSHYVIALFVDIRGFSSFGKTVDSTLSALFIKKFYLKIIDDYFNKASFFKTTGDGLMIIIPTEEKELAIDIENTISDCFRLIINFPSFFSGDPMINFPVPDKLGIGLSRGSASYLISQDKIIDYSGDILNKAARLMDIARPSGIVFDSTFGIELLSEELRKQFSRDKVYIRSFAESNPIEVYYSKDFTTIRPTMKIPINEVQPEKMVEEYTLSEISRLHNFTYFLSSKPLEPDKIRIEVRFPRLRGGKIEQKFFGLESIENYEYFEDVGEPRLRIFYDPIYKKLKAKKLRGNHKITIVISYEKRMAAT